VRRRRSFSAALRYTNMVVPPPSDAVDYGNPSDDTVLAMMTFIDLKTWIEIGLYEGTLRRLTPEEAASTPKVSRIYDGLHHYVWASASMEAVRRLMSDFADSLEEHAM
jgi:hypothetical protein